LVCSFATFSFATFSFIWVSSGISSYPSGKRVQGVLQEMSSHLPESLSVRLKLSSPGSNGAPQELQGKWKCTQRRKNRILRHDLDICEKGVLQRQTGATSHN
jgi:hypothetical protein